MGRRLLPRLRDFVFIMIFAGALTTGVRMLNTDSDLGRHLALGRYILASGRVPTQDILSFTKAGESRPPYEWLTQVILAGAYRLLKLDGVVLLISLLIALAFTVVYVDCIQRSGMPILALLIAVWAALASSLHWLARPHVFSFLFFAIWLYGLERWRRGDRWPLWAFPALMLVWANTHGGFIFGFIALAAYLAGWLLDLWRKAASRADGTRLFIVGLTSGLASLLTPDIWHNWDAVLNNRSRYVLSRTAETMPLRLTTLGTWPFLALLMLAIMLLLYLRMRVPAAHLFLLGGLAALSIAIVRNIPFFAIAAAPILSEWAAQALTGLRTWRRVEDRFAEIDAALQAGLWSALVVLIAVGIFAYRDARTHASTFRFRQDLFPVQAADWVDQHPQSGRMFNDFNWGGYLLYRLWPRQQVFIDSQSDFYGEALTKQAAEIAAGAPGWDADLVEYDISWILVPRTSGLAQAAAASSAWQIEYQDDVAIILIRK